MKKQRNVKIWLIPALVLLTGGLGFTVWKLTARKPRGVTYQPVPVARGTLRQTVLSTGTVTSSNRLELKPPIGGRVERILVQEGQLVRRGQILAWMSSAERAGLLDTARAKGKAELKYWEDAYKATPLVAPINGIIILRNVEPGQTVTQADPVVVMSDKLVVKAHVDETDIADIKLDQAAEVVLDAFPKVLLPSKVTHIAFDAKTVNNVTTYEVEVTVGEAPPYMKSGMTTNVTFVVAVKEDALIVPAAAVRREHGKLSVLMPAPEGEEPVVKEVEVGISDGKKSEIVSGLDEGEKVLVASVPAMGKRNNANTNSPFSPFGTSKAPPGGGRR